MKSFPWMPWCEKLLDRSGVKTVWFFRRMYNDFLIIKHFSKRTKKRKICFFTNFLKIIMCSIESLKEPRSRYYWKIMSEKRESFILMFFCLLNLPQNPHTSCNVRFLRKEIARSGKHIIETLMEAINVVIRRDWIGMLTYINNCCTFGIFGYGVSNTADKYHVSIKKASISRFWFFTIFALMLI